MSPETPSAQATHGTPPDLKNEPFTRPTLLPVCCLCGLIRDDQGSLPGLESWLKPRTHRKIYGMKHADCSFTHTYCPTCFTKVQQTIAQYLKQIGEPR